jgi:hypothetical protein
MQTCELLWPYISFVKTGKNDERKAHYESKLKSKARQSNRDSLQIGAKVNNEEGGEQGREQIVGGREGRIRRCRSKT